LSFVELRSEQARQAIDAEQVFEAWRSARRERIDRFSGAMTWKRVSGRDYLYRKPSATWKSLGPRGPETERAYRSFHEGRSRLDERLAALSRRLDEMAPVNRALALGRVPLIAARVMRALDLAGLMGTLLEVVGTNALFVYERLAGVQIESGELATGDIDLLFDARSRLRIASREGREPPSLIELLRKVDRSFAPTGHSSFPAVNRDGFMVDLITPMPRDRLRAPSRQWIGPSDDDLRAVEIEGLGWLANSPKVQATLLDSRGYPLQVTAPDPRAYALHKDWLARRPDRDPLKAGRDAAQARLVAQLVATRLRHLAVPSSDLSALPAVLRDAADRLFDVATSGRPVRRLEPGW
jgi:hypothetical protein